MAAVWPGAVAAVAAGAMFAGAAGVAAPLADPARGARLFLQCRACHTVGRGEANGAGPNLWGVVGSPAASRPGYRYSAALSGSGVVWTPQALDAWLTRPTALVPGVTMAFPGVASAQSRADLVAYLSTLR